MNSKKRNQVDLILPCYRPRKGWFDRVCQDSVIIDQAFMTLGYKLILHLVDDGSGGDYFSIAELDAMRERLPDLEFHSYKQNRGKGYSLRFGVSQSEGEYQIYTDYDFPFSAESVIEVLQKLTDGADVVMGARGATYYKNLPLLRLFMSHGVKIFNRIFLGFPPEVSDTQAGLKGFNQRGKAAFLATQTDQFLFDTEFILIALKMGLRVDRLSIKLRKGIHMSRMGWKVIYRESMNMLKIIWRYRFRKKVDL